MSPLSGTWHENQFISSISFSSVSPAAEVMACPLFRLLVFYIPPVMSTNIHMAECSRLLLTQWRDFDSWSETEESDEDVRRYKFLSRPPAFWVLDLAWPQFCSHLHFSSLHRSEKTPALLWTLHVFWLHFRLSCSWTRTQVILILLCLLF